MQPVRLALDPQPAPLLPESSLDAHQLSALVAGGPESRSAACALKPCAAVSQPPTACRRNGESPPGRRGRRKISLK